MGITIKCSDYDGECTLIGSAGESCPLADDMNCLDNKSVVVDEEEKARAEAELKLIFSTVGLPWSPHRLCRDQEDCDDDCPGQADEKVCSSMWAASYHCCGDYGDCSEGCPGDKDNDICDDMCERDPAIIQDRAEIAKDSIPEVDPLTVLENRAKEADVMEGQLTLLTAEVAELKAFIENYDRLADVAADVITELNEKVMEEQSKNTKLAKALLAIVSWTETMDNLMAEITKDLLE